MRALAFCVHVLTACGAGVALLALIAAARGDWAAMFLWLGAALIIDGIDGPLARAVKVAERQSRWSGEVLDLVVDFATYVFVPAYAIASAGLVAEPWNFAAGFAVAVSGGLYFADRDMKTAQNYFRGFPAVWNLIAFYLLLLRPGAWLSAAAVAAFVVLTFTPMRFVHPLRVRRLRSVTIGLLAVWAIFALVALYHGLEPGLWIKTVLSAVAVYFLLAGLLPDRRGHT
jgi:phosphatidylcholine synthase